MLSEEHSSIHLNVIKCRAQLYMGEAFSQKGASVATEGRSLGASMRHGLADVKANCSLTFGSPSRRADAGIGLLSKLKSLSTACGIRCSWRRCRQPAQRRSSVTTNPSSRTHRTCTSVEFCQVCLCVFFWGIAVVIDLGFRVDYRLLTFIAVYYCLLPSMTV